MYSHADTLAPELPKQPGGPARATADAAKTGEEKPSPEKILAEIAQNSRIQAENSRKQLFYVRICAIALAAIFVAVIICAALVVPRTVRVLDNVNALSDRLDNLDLEAVLDDAARLLETIGPVADRLEPLMDSVNDTVLEAQRDMEQALRAIQSIDIETLNDAIADLAAIVEPLARLFGK